MISIQKNELKSKLNKISGIMTSDFITSTALFEVNNGSSTIVATDLVTALRQKITLSSMESTRFCVNKKIVDIVKEIDDESITLEYHNNNKRLLLQAGKSMFKIPCRPAEDYPQWPAFENEEWVAVNAEDFAENIMKVLSFIARDKYDVKNCVLLEVTADSIKYVGTDGFRLAVIEKKAETGITEAKKYLVPEKSASEITKFLSGKKEVTLGLGNFLLIQADGDEMVVRPLESNNTYPAYEKAITTDFSNHSRMFVKKEPFIKALKMISTLANDKPVVRLTITENNLTVSASSDLGEASDELEVLYDGGEEFEIGFNAKFLLDILRAASSEDPIFYFAGEKSPCYTEGGEGELYIVMPMVITKPKPTNPNE